MLDILGADNYSEIGVKGGKIKVKKPYLIKLLLSYGCPFGGSIATINYHKLI